MSQSVVEGGNMVQISPHTLNLEEVRAFVTDPSAGGISIFMGEIHQCIIHSHVCKPFILFHTQGLPGIALKVINLSSTVNSKGE